MKQFGSVFLLSLISIVGISQGGPRNSKEANTLLWKITGKDLKQPSYLFGTIHMFCSDDEVLSDSLKYVISKCDEVYLEVDISDIFEMIGAIGQMKMRDDTTLSDLLTKKDYEKVKNYFEKNSSMMPFSMLETFKPILAASTIAESALTCESVVFMEQLIADEAKKSDKKLKGLETMSYQAGILDNIPYKQQAMELVKYIDNLNDDKGADKEMEEMVSAYKNQDLKKMEELMMKSDIGVNNYTDILLYNRNRNWVAKLKTLLPSKALVIAVGAGHLPGEQGLINLLRKEGYTVTPVDNKLKKFKSI